MLLGLREMGCKFLVDINYLYIKYQIQHEEEKHVIVDCLYTTEWDAQLNCNKSLLKI